MESGQITVLTVDDDDDSLFALKEVLTRNGYRVLAAATGKQALEILDSEIPDLILSDVVMPEMDGLEFTRLVKNHPSFKFIPLFLLTSKVDPEDVARGLDVGADGYLKKPFEVQELLATIKSALRIRRLYENWRSAEVAYQEVQRRESGRVKVENIIGQSAALREVFSLIDKVADSDVPVLISGESGTGKELVAQAIHYNSHRKNKPFIAQNCSAFNENLLESELFGHVKGSFTGAVTDKVGLFEAADGGTFFLDELGEMSPALQVKLLRVLQEGTFIPVGSTKTKKVDVRIVAATNRDLLKMAQEGKFREDLYYRLNVVNIVLPPLRERRSDIPLLVEHFLRQHAKRHNRQPKELTQECLLGLCQYDWPGNIRQLQNEIERLILLSGQEKSIGKEILSKHIAGAAEGREGLVVTQAGPAKLKDAIEGLERTMILGALEETKGNKSEAAKVLGISRSNLIAKVQAYDLERE